MRQIDGGPWSAGSGESATLVVRTSTNPKDEGIEEDLQVMHRILEKAIGRHSEGNARGQAMGIQLFALGGSRGPRSFYIEGYGLAERGDRQEAGAKNQEKRCKS